MSFFGDQLGRFPTFAIIALLVAVAGLAPAQETRPADPAGRHPLLEQLNQETEAFYREVGQSLVRVQMPRPRWMEAYAKGNINWEKMDPEFRRRLENQARAGAAAPQAAEWVIRQPANAAKPATQPATQPAKLDGRGMIIFVPAQNESQKQQQDPVLGGRLEIHVTAGAPFSPNNVGLLLDNAGHILVPLYIERETAAAGVIQVAFKDGKALDAKFVGSDRQTNLTLLQIANTEGRPIQLSPKKPAEGSMVLYVSPTDGSGRLGLWNSSTRDVGIIFTLDGGVAGIGRYGQFLSASSCNLIAEQLIRFGAVRRATLGVIVSQISKDDPLREQLPVLGNRTALRINEVVAGSVADKAGLKPGDLLLALAGEAVSDIPSLAADIAARNGATELQILRGNEISKVTVELQQQK